MKKSILIFCTALTILSLTAFAYINRSNTVTDQEEATRSQAVVLESFLAGNITKLAGPGLFYKVSSRFIATITKEKLNQAKSIIDILPGKATRSRESYQNARVSILHKDKEITEVGEGEILNTAQIKLLQSTTYSTDIRITSICSRKNSDTGALEEDSLVYYMTIIPEKEAEFVGGHDALIKYLKEGTKGKTAVIKRDKLQPGKVSFSVTKEGKIANVKLSYTSGYPSVDAALVELIAHMPEKWNSATNSKGEKVDQELVFFFGLEGC